MTNDGQKPGHPTFRVEDEIDRLFARANPNPTREGCPPREVLAGLARRQRSLDDPGYEHLTKCSPCFIEFCAVRDGDLAQAAAVRRRMLGYGATAAVVALVIAGSWFVFGRGRGPGQATTAEQSARLDLRPFTVTRSDQTTVEPDSLILPRGRLSVTILLPVGAQPGAYELQVLDADLKTRASSTGVAAIRDFVTTLEASIDVSALPAGSYRLALRREGEDWRFFPALIRSGAGGQAR